MADDTKPPRPQGRPKSDEPGTTLSVWVRSSEYDRLIQAANKNEQSISAYVRSLLKTYKP